jgi:hypothetical protein
MSALLAGGFETGAILSWAIPLALLLVVCVWWIGWLRRGGRQP